MSLVTWLRRKLGGGVFFLDLLEPYSRSEITFLEKKVEKSRPYKYPPPG